MEYSKWGRLGRFAASAALVVAAAWLAVPSRNQYGNPSMETLVGECRLAAGDVVRLYRGSGGATTSFWYSVTFDGGLLGRERQVVFAYAKPEVRGIQCAEDSVEVMGDAPRASYSRADLSRLQENPRTYWRGELRDTTEATQTKTILRYFLMIGLLIAAAWVSYSRKK